MNDSLVRIQGIETWWIIICSKLLGIELEYSYELVLTWIWNWNVLECIKMKWIKSNLINYIYSLLNFYCISTLWYKYKKSLCFCCQFEFWISRVVLHYTNFYEMNDIYYFLYLTGALTIFMLTIAYVSTINRSITMSPFEHMLLEQRYNISTIINVWKCSLI